MALFRKRNDTEGMENNMAIRIENAEDNVTDYIRTNDGPLWGETEEARLEELAAELRKLYLQAGTPAADQLYGGGV
jgi:hypothetical protein